MFNPTEIAADEAVIAGAFPGEDGPLGNAGWYTGGREDIDGHSMGPIYRDGSDSVDTVGYIYSDDDLKFTLLARTRWPLYVAEVKRLKTPVKVSRVGFCVSLDSKRGVCACGDFVNGWQNFCPNCGVPLMWEER